MLTANEIMELIYTILKANLRVREEIHFSRQNDVDQVFDMLGRIRSDDTELRSTADQKEAYLKVSQLPACGVSRASYEHYPTHKRGGRKVLLSSREVHKFGWDLAIAQATVHRGAKIIIYIDTMFRCIYKYLQRNPCKPKAEIHIIQYFVLRTLWHERRHQIQFYYKKMFGGMMSDILQKDEEQDAEYWARIQYWYMRGCIDVVKDMVYPWLQYRHKKRRKALPTGQTA